MALSLIDLLQTNDALVWAQEFIDTMRRQNWDLNDIDEGLMIGWFANAMAAQEMEDARRIKQREREFYDKFLESDSGVYIREQSNTTLNPNK